MITRQLLVRRFSLSVAPNSRRRVVITGQGVVSPIGVTVEKAWNNLLASRCGIKKLTGTEYQSLPCRIAAFIDDQDLKVENFIAKTELKSMSKSTIFALIAASEALATAGWDSTTDEEELCRTGVCVGIGMVDLKDIYDSKRDLDTSYNSVSPRFIPRILPNMAGGQISIKYGFKGPNHSVSTACATGAHSIGDSFRFIKDDYADVMVCGGAEAPINPLAVAGFCRLRALTTTFNDDPTKASRPFDQSRNGFVMGEGSGILVLEELEHALKRKATIFGEIIGYGLSGDASHLTAPRKDGLGAILAMRSALKSGGIDANQVGYINAHATSTPIGDAIESRAIKTLFGNHSKNLFVSSTKGNHGHLLGSAGNLEAVFTILACKTGTIPPTINLENTSPDMDLNYTPNITQQWPRKESQRRIALKNAFGFGGTNACLCFAEYLE